MKCFASAVVASVVLVAAGASAGEASNKASRLPMESLPIVARIAVPVGPAWLATGFGSVWVTKINSQEVLRIDPNSNKVIATIRVGSKPELGIGIGLGFVWIADTKDKSIKQIDPSSNKVVHSIAVKLPKETEGSIGVGEGSLWALTDDGDTDSGTLSRIDPFSGELVASIRVNAGSHCALVAFGSVWVTNSAGGAVLRVDPRTDSVVAEITVRQSPRFLAASDDSLWVLNQGDGSLSRIDPQSNQVSASVELGTPGQGGDLSISDGYVWASAEGVPLSQIDLRTNHVMRQFAGGKRVDTLRVGFGSAWLVDELHGQIWRVDLSRLAELPSS